MNINLSEWTTWQYTVDFQFHIAWEGCFPSCLTRDENNRQETVSLCSILDSSGVPKDCLGSHFSVCKRMMGGWNIHDLSFVSFPYKLLGKANVSCKLQNIKESI